MRPELKKRIITSFFLSSLLLLMFEYYFILFLSSIIIGIISWIELYALISKIYKKKTVKETIYRFIGKGISLFYLSYVIFLLTLNTDLKIYIYFSILISIFTDIGGLTIGRIFKGKKLIKISPNKTISGAIGSFCFSLLLIPFFMDQLNHLNIYLLIFLTLLISMTSQLGDLFISLLKRKAKVKDTSDLLPGHGGFLDRIDGVIFAIPIGFFLLKSF